MAAPPDEAAWAAAAAAAAKAKLGWVEDPVETTALAVAKDGAPVLISRAEQVEAEMAAVTAELRMMTERIEGLTAAAASRKSAPRGGAPDPQQPSALQADVAAPSASGQPWRRRVNASILKRILTIKAKLLSQRFGWDASRGAPRMAFSMGECLLELEPGQRVMDFNKEGRDGFPFKPRWVGVLLEALGAQVDDTLVLQHRHTDSAGVMHVAASLERASDAQAQATPAAAAAPAAPQPSWSPSATANCDYGQRSDFASVLSDAGHGASQAGGGEPEVQQAAKKRRRSESPLLAGEAKQALVCQHCGRKFVYRAPFDKHEARCQREREEVERLRQQREAEEERRREALLACHGGAAAQHTHLGSSENLDALLAAIEETGGHAQPTVQPRAEPEAAPAASRVQQQQQQPGEAAAPAATAQMPPAESQAAPSPLQQGPGRPDGAIKQEGDTTQSEAAGQAQPQSPLQAPLHSNSSAATAAKEQAVQRAKEQAAQRHVLRAVQAFEAADIARADSMRRPLGYLVLAGRGGELLKRILEQWPTYSLEQQQRLFDAALVPTLDGALQDLEAQLRLALH